MIAYVSICDWCEVEHREPLADMRARQGATLPGWQYDDRADLLLCPGCRNARVDALTLAEQQRRAARSLVPRSFSLHQAADAGNVILCPRCFGGGEEKACGHGLRAGITCSGCAVVRQPNDPPWSCVGSSS